MWNVLQKQDEHRALSNVDTKQRAYSHLSPKTTQYEFKWQHRTVRVDQQTDFIHFWLP